MKIPILNIYYLLCYAWNKLEESGLVDVKTEDSTTLLDLFARVLISGTTHILKRGLDRGYIPDGHPKSPTHGHFKIPHL